MKKILNEQTDHEVSSDKFIDIKLDEKSYTLLIDLFSVESSLNTLPFPLYCLHVKLGKKLDGEELYVLRYFLQELYSIGNLDISRFYREKLKVELLKFGITINLY